MTGFDGITQHDTRRLMDLVLDDVGGMLRQRDQAFALQLGVEGGVQELQRQQLAQEAGVKQAEDAALLQSDLLLSPIRQPGARAQVEDRLANLAPGPGLDLEQIRQLRELHSRRKQFVGAFDEDVAGIQQVIQGIRQRREGGGQSLAAGVQGLLSGLTLSDRPTAQETIGRQLAHAMRQAVERRYGPEVSGEGAPIRLDAGRFLPGEKPAGEPHVSRGTYEALLGKRTEELMRTELADVLDESGMEKFLGKVGEYASMAVPFGAAAKAGGVVGKGAAGLARALGGAAKVGLGAEKAAKYAKPLMELGVAGSKLGRAAQGMGGTMAVLMGYGAAQGPSEQDEAAIAQLPEERQAPARDAARLERGMMLALTYPLFHFGGQLGGKLAGLVPGKGMASVVGRGVAGGAGTAAVFPGLGELIGKAQGEVGPFTRELLEYGVLTDEKLRGPLEQMVRAAVGGDGAAVVSAAERYAEEFLPGFAAFGAMHLVGALKADVDRSKLINLRFRAVREIAEGAPEALREELTKGLDRIVGEAPREKRSDAEEAALELLGSPEAVERAVRERVALERIQEGQAVDLPARLSELRTLQREAESKAERDPTEENIAEAERLFQGEEYLRALERGDDAAAARALDRYEGVESTAEQRGLQQELRVETERERIVRELARPRTRAPIEEEGFWRDHVVRGISDLPRGAMQETGGLAASGLSMRGEWKGTFPEIYSGGPTGRILVFRREDVGQQDPMLGARIPEGAQPVVRLSRAEVEAAGGNLYEAYRRQVEGWPPDAKPVPPAEQRGLTELPMAADVYKARDVQSEEGYVYQYFPGTAERIRREHERKLPAHEQMASLQAQPEFQNRLAEVRASMPELDEARSTAEAAYRVWAKQEGYTPARTLLEEGNALKADLDVVEQYAGEPGVLLQWWGQNRDQILGPAGRAMRLDPATRAHIERADALRAKLIAHLNETGGVLPGGLGFTGRSPFSKAIETVREGMLGRDWRRVQKWTKQAERTLDDPTIRSRLGVDRNWWKSPVRTMTQLFVRGTALFESPIGEFGGFAAEAGRVQGFIDSQTFLMRAALEREMERAGVRESDVFKPGEKVVKDLANRDHLLREMVEKGPGDAIWQRGDAALQEAATNARALLTRMRDLAARASPSYGRMEMDLAFARKMAKRRGTEESAARVRAVEVLADVMKHRETRVPWSHITRIEDVLTSLRGRKDKQARELRKRLNRDLAEWKESLLAAAESVGIDDPLKARARAGQIAKKGREWRKKVEAIEGRMQALVDSWGFTDGYMHQIPAYPIERGDEWTRGERVQMDRFGVVWPMEPAQRVTSGMARRRRGQLEVMGLVEPSFVRSMDAYLRKVIPYVHWQRFLRRYDPALYGEWRAPEIADLVHGFNTGPKKIDIRYAGSGRYTSWHAVLGGYVREKGTFRRPKKGERITHVLLDRAEADVASRARDLQLADGEWVKRELDKGNLAAIPFGDAQDAIRIRDGGFFREVSPTPFLLGTSRADSMRDYINTLTKTYRREVEGGLLSRELESAASKFFRTAAYWMSTKTLGFYNAFSAVNAGTGAMFVNSLILGPARAAKASQHSFRYLKRLHDAKLSGDPAEDLFANKVDPESVEAFRLEGAKRLRTGEDELFDDFAEWYYQSGLLSGTRGSSYFQRTGRKGPGEYVTRAGSAVEGAVEGTRSALDKTWAVFDGMEYFVRTGLAAETYTMARRAGASKVEAEQKAAAATIMAHGVFNPALRSRFFRHGFGMALGSLQGWVANFTGVLLRLPLDQKARALAATLGAAQIASALGMDWGNTIGLPLRSVPLVGEELEGQVRERVLAPGEELMRDNVSWLNEFFGGRLMPAGTTIPNFVIDPDSPFLQILEDIRNAVALGVEGRWNEVERALWRAGAHAAVPRTVEYVRKAIDTRPLDAGAREYQTLDKLITGEGASTTLWHHGLAQVWRDLVPGTPLEESVQHAEIRYMRYRKQKREGARRDAKLDLVKLQRRALEGEQVGAEIGEWVRRAHDLEMLGGKSANTQLERYLRDTRNVALLEKHGLRRFAYGVLRAETKLEKLRAMADWLEDPNARISREDIMRAQRVLGGKQGFSAWLQADDVPATLQARYLRALSARMRKDG